MTRPALAVLLGALRRLRARLTDAPPDAGDGRVREG